MDKYIAEREAKALKGFDIPKHAVILTVIGALALRVSETSRVRPGPLETR
jgi:hypothetical protein